MNKYEKRAEDNLARMFVLYGQIGAKLRELGHKTGSGFQVDGIWSPFEITIDSPSDYRRFYTEAMDKLRVQVRTAYGSKQFPQRKKGFDIDAIGRFISKEVTRKREINKAEVSRRQKDKKHTATLSKVAEELGLEVHLGQVYGPLAVKADHRGIHVTLTVNNIQDEWDLKDAILKMRGTGLVKE